MAMLYLTKKCDGIFNFPVLDNLFIMSLLDGALRHYELLSLLYKLMMNFRRNTVHLTHTIKLMIY